MSTVLCYQLCMWCTGEKQNTLHMNRYTHADFNDDDNSSINSIQLTEGVSSGATHIRYHQGGVGGGALAAGHALRTALWRRRTPLERILIVVVSVLLFVVLVLTLVLHSTEEAARQRAAHESHEAGGATKLLPCLNKTCIKIASRILDGMDLTVDPCEDFYAYACNGWESANPVPDGRSSWGTFTKLEWENQLVIKKALEQPMASLHSDAERKAKMYYDSCMDTNETMEALGAEPLLQLLHQLGGWNLTGSGQNSSSYNASDWSLQRLLQLVQNRYNIGAFFSYAIGEDDRDSARHVLQLDQSGLTLPTRDVYLNGTAEHRAILDAYFEYMMRVVVLLGGRRGHIEPQIRAVIQLETRLANITAPPEQRRDEETLYNVMTVGGLQQLAGFIDWRAFFEDGFLATVNRTISDQERIVVYAPHYLSNLTRLMREYQRTREGRVVLTNYMVWQTVRFFSGCLSKAFRDAYKVLRKALMGTDGTEEPQWRYCIQDTTNALGFAVGAIYVREVFQSADAKEHVEEMIGRVRHAFTRNFAHLQWMDEETRKVALGKADRIADMIGYPDFIKSPAQLDAKYQQLTIGGDTYFENNVNVNFYNLVRNLEKINQPVNRTAWSMAPSAVNAYYTPTKNQMVLPAGILQAPFYDVTYPSSLNYGAIGVVMGHELTHGFDDQGREFDGDGNLNHWWQNQTVDRFKARTRCFTEQYGKYAVNGNYYINGNQTLGENIADNGGVKAAYNAYLSLQQHSGDVDRQHQVEPLPGIHLSHSQLFFVAFAQVWCSTATKEALQMQLEKDSHAPARYRVIGALTNLEEFARVFQCRAGSAMNPRRKCEVW